MLKENVSTCFAEGLISENLYLPLLIGEDRSFSTAHLNNFFFFFVETRKGVLKANAVEEIMSRAKRSIVEYNKNTPAPIPTKELN